MKVMLVLLALLVAGCSGAEPTASSSDAGVRGADLSGLEAEGVHTGAAGTGARGGVTLTVADEARVLDLGRICVSDREAAGPLCTQVDEPSAAGVTVQVEVANASDAEVQVDPGNASMYAGPLPAETADQFAQSLQPVTVAPGDEASGAMVWVLSGPVEDVEAAMAAGDYGFEVMVTDTDGQPVVTRTTVGVLTSEAPAEGDADTPSVDPGALEGG